jgi:transposase
MKTMLKSELARKAGVSERTLMNWCRPYREELRKMGLGSKAKLLPPHVVKFLCEKFCIIV